MEYVDPTERASGMTQEPYGLAMHELQQAAETGHDVTEARAAFGALDPTDYTGLMALYDSLPTVPPAGWPHLEASGLDAILAALPAAPAPVEPPPDLRDRVLGGWTGRVVGNMLGKPVEIGWPRAALTAYLEEEDALPLDDYVPLADPARAAELGFTSPFIPYGAVTRGRVDGGVRDDDVDYSVLALHLLEQHGTGYMALDVAIAWLRLLPLQQTYTAERATYQNLVREVPLAEAGGYRNPFREWIGALIRADVFGWVSPGDPRRAALLAFPDASLSHRSNGIYGAMWAAALVATAFTAASPERSIRESLLHVPPTSRLAEEVRAVLDDFGAARSWDEAMDALEARHPGMSWVHTVNNAGALTAAILWGGGDFSTTVGLAARAGLDADSIGATAGSWAGVFVGARGIPSHWTAPLHDRTTSAVFGFGEVRMSDLAERTVRLIAAGPGR